jgi:hypothetical protein
MASVTSPTESQLSKKVYGDRYERLPFNYTIIQDMAPFTSKFKLGDTFKYAVEVAMEQGASYLGSSGAEATLAAAIVGINQQTDISAYETQMRTRITTRAFEEATGQGEAAFESATRTRMVALQTASEFRFEESCLYGQEGLFQVSANNAGVLTITDATWSSTKAVRLINALLESWSTQAATATQRDADLQVTGVDLDAKTITVTGTNSATVANDWLYFKGARTSTTWSEMAGIHKLMTTTSGTLLGVNVGTYPWFKPNVSSSFGRPTFLLILKAIRKLVGRNTISAKKDDTQATKLLLPSVSYEILNSDLMSSRRFDGSYNRGKGTTGVEAIEFIGQVGVTQMMVHPMLRDADALAIGPDNLFRVGTNDIKWDQGPDGKTDVWTKTPDKNSYEARTYWIQHPAMFAPGRTVAITGMTE